MIAKNVSRATLYSAAQAVGVNIDVKTLNTKGTRHQVKVNPNDTKDAHGNRTYQRVSPQGRRIAAVCWHGFRDYFRAAFALEPEAQFQTALDTWKGAEDFEARFRASGEKNAGSQMYPVRACEVCVCPDSGNAY